jgi:hypothetical protein
MSTTNHNILYFFSVCRIRPLNMGICLWKAQNRLSGRGFGAGPAPKLVQSAGRLPALASIKSLASMRAIHKRQNRCRSTAFLCELWTTPPIYLMTSKEGAVLGMYPRQDSLRPGGTIIGRLLPVLRNEELLGGILGPIPAAVASQDDPALLTGSLRCCLAGRLRLCCPPIQVLFTGSRFGLLRPSR